MKVDFLRVWLPGLALILAPAVFAAAAPVDYLHEVKPLLAEQCYRCHGARQQKGGLRLDTAAFARKGGERGPALKEGRSTESLLLQAVQGTHPELARMPFKKPPLNEAQVALLKQWIDQGASAPADEPAERTVHWAFAPPARPAVPRIDKPRYAARNPIDAFILARLGQEGIAPSPEADRVTLLRRLSLDLVGLPPAPAEVDDFANDARPDAYERVVERLLASAHYGERWGRWWLDAARYADSNGYSIDAPRQVWKYRDWVIAALNRDLPFDQFVVEQLAGDLLPDATIEQKLATGFQRNTQINQEGGIDPEQFRVESVVDRVNTAATVFLGITLGCAQCHDHKFDPFTQREYYQMLAFFNSTEQDGHAKGTPGGLLEIPGEFERRENAQREISELEDDVDRYLDTQGSAMLKWEQALTPEESAKLKSSASLALRTAPAERTKEQKRAVYAAFRPEDPEFKSRHARLVKLLRREPKPVTSLVMMELAEPRETRLLIKGDFTRPGEQVMPGFPAVLHSFKVGQASSLSSDSAGTGQRPVLLNRLDLARWIVDPDNPLTARVLVNRVWQQYFGRGIVETENDFGTQGTPPTHPALLDWLACEFASPVEAWSVAALQRSSVQANDGGQSLQPFNASTLQPFNPSAASPWSLKRLHRLIVTSATYRQASRARPDLPEIDPNNKLLARQSRLRLDAEIIRDVSLAASGRLSPKLGGPPVFPPQPAGVMTLGQVKREWSASTAEDRWRRGIYTHLWRATPHPALTVFDAPDAFSTCTRRLRSNTPLQALTLLNDQQYYEAAEGLAERILEDGPSSDLGRLDYAFRLCLARKASRDEVERLRGLLAEERRELAGDSNREREAWTTVARVLLNLDETITRE